jgi:signal transduction histidine kinase
MLSLQNLPGPDKISLRRSERYLGDDAGASLTELPAEQRELVHDLYRYLRRALRAAQQALHSADPMELTAFLKETNWRRQIDNLAKSLYPQPGAEPRLRHAYHDLRGGALSAASGRAELARLKGNEAELDDAYGFFYAVRDHLKIMRNCLVDLDPERRKRDTSSREHSASLFREKWENYENDGVKVEYISDFDGGIASCCLEFSSAERVVYNLVNNAIKHTADDTVRLFVTTIQPESDKPHVKIVTSNTVKSDEKDKMLESLNGELSTLFQGGFTIGGTGDGLSICAEFVANAYGLVNIHEAIRDGYVGARLHEEQFVAWVHWPAFV